MADKENMQNSDFLKDIKAKVKPGFCSLGVTERCIFKCKMCHKWQDAVREEPPTIAQYKNFISNLKELVDDDVKLHFGGGEVLLFEGILDLVKFSSEKGFSTQIASNGWLIDEQMAKRITDSGLNEIGLSLDSLNENTHDYLRGVEGAHCRVMDAIGYLRKYSQDIKIGVHSIICDYNLDDLAPLLEWADSNDTINSIFFFAIAPSNNIGIEEEWWKGQYGRLWPKDTEKVCSFVDNVLKIKGRKIGNSFSQLKAFKRYFRHPERFVKETECNFGRMLQVNASGDISFLCPQSEILGNIKKGGDIKEIWFSEYANHSRKKIETCKNNCHYLINVFFEGDYPFGME